MTYQELSELYSQINNYILQHFVFFWAVILGIIALLGVALYFVAKSMTQEGITHASKSFDGRMDSLEGKSLKTSSTIDNCLNTLSELEKRIAKIEHNVERGTFSCSLQTFSGHKFIESKCHYIRRENIISVEYSIMIDGSFDQVDEFSENQVHLNGLPFCVVQPISDALFIKYLNNEKKKVIPIQTGEVATGWILGVYNQSSSMRALTVSDLKGSTHIFGSVTYLFESYYDKDKPVISPWIR